MAGNWRDYRLIVIDDVRYRWQFQDDYLLGYPDGLLVRPEEQPQTYLRVIWNGRLIARPGYVRACIELALNRGWRTEHPQMTLTPQDLEASGIRVR